MKRDIEKERSEALGNLVYFQEMLSAQEQAAKRMEANIKLCKKNVALWSGRIERLTPSRTKDAKGGA
jgi:hypothetical protein